MSVNLSQPTFDGLGIAPKLIEILDKLGFKTPTPIQAQSIPIAISGKDMMGIAQTGTGKTLAFGIPMLQRLAGNKTKGLIIVPTRELAVQVNDHLQKLGSSIGLKTAVLIGGESMGRQLSMLRAQPRVIIATPGRLIDHVEQRTVKLDDVSILVLDEADRMLDMGFAPQLRKIAAHLPKERQTMLFSATMDPEIVSIASAYLKLPVRIEVAPAGSTATQVTQEIFFVQRYDKGELLKKILKEYLGSVLVFSRTKHGAKKITQGLRATGLTAAEIHSNRSLSQRLEALNGFKLGKYRVLVATDIAARGIDVTGIELVVNFDLPENAADYVHRIGRTGRAGHTGHAISLATPDQRNDVRAIERLIKKPLPVSQTPKIVRENVPQQERMPVIGRENSNYSGSRDSGRSHSYGGYNRNSGGDRNERKSSDRFPSRPNRDGANRHGDSSRSSSSRGPSKRMPYKSFAPKAKSKKGPTTVEFSW